MRVASSSTLVAGSTAAVAIGPTESKCSVSRQNILCLKTAHVRKEVTWRSHQSAEEGEEEYRKYFTMRTKLRTKDRERVEREFQAISGEEKALQML